MVPRTYFISVIFYKMSLKSVRQLGESFRHVMRHRESLVNMKINKKIEEIYLPCSKVEYFNTFLMLGQFPLVIFLLYVFRKCRTI